MDMFSLIIGITLGAAFSPFWLKVWNVIKTKAVEWMKTKP